MDNTSGHLSNNPGLRGHSSDPSQDLLKQFVVAKQVKHGWLWVASFDTLKEVDSKGYQFPGSGWRIIDQFNDQIIWEDKD